MIREYLEIQKQTDTKFKKAGESYTDVITFTTTLSAGVTPDVTIKTGAGVDITGNLSPTAKRVDTHEVFISIDPVGAKSLVADIGSLRQVTSIADNPLRQQR